MEKNFNVQGHHLFCSFPGQVVAVTLWCDRPSPEGEKNMLSALTIGRINHRVSHACFAGTSPLRDVNLRVGFSL